MELDIEKCMLCKISWCIVLFIMLLYFVVYIDWVNIGFVVLMMKVDLGFMVLIFGFGVGIFFWGYFLFEVFFNIVLYKVGVCFWIVCVMVMWGIILVVMVFV